MRDCHRAARTILDEPDTKKKIAAFFVTRQAELKRKRYFKVLFPMLSYFEAYGTADHVGELIRSCLPQFTSAESIRTIQGHDSGTY